MLTTLLGALLIICGVLFMATQAVWRGRLSQPRQAEPTAPGATLEPRRRGGGFGLKANWPGFVLVALGAILLFVGAVA
jgi:hypothetical protein